MAKKVDYLKVEQAIEEGIHQMKVRKLLRYADLSMSIGLLGSKPKGLTNIQKKDIGRAVLKNLEVDMLTLKKKDPELYAKLELDKQELKHYFEHPSELSPSDWEKIKTIRQKVDLFRKEIKKKIHSQSDEEIVNKQYKKQKNSRYDINDTWIPLH